MPGHTGGWLALKDAGLQFCGSFPAHEERPQLYHDPVRPPNPHVRSRQRPLQAVESSASHDETNPTHSAPVANGRKLSVFGLDDRRM